MRKPKAFAETLKDIHSRALARVGGVTAETIRKSEQLEEFREPYRTSAPRLRREIVMPILIEFSRAVPGVSGPIEVNEPLDDDFEAYVAKCQIAPATPPDKAVKLTIRIMPDTVRSGMVIECDIFDKEAGLFHDASDFVIDAVDEQKLRQWLENAVTGAYERFCELHYPPSAS